MMRISKGLMAGFLGFVMCASGAANAQPSGFTRGPLITEYGPVIEVEAAAALPDGVNFNVAFDVTERGGTGGINRRFESAARFLNMHAAAGVPADRMNVAIVVHGPAVKDLTHNIAYGGKNANGALIETLQAHGVTVYVCGQSAAAQNVAADDLLPGVEMAISAMTAHALLQQKGYTLNPF